MYQITSRIEFRPSPFRRCVRLLHQLQVSLPFRLGCYYGTMLSILIFIDS